MEFDINLVKPPNAAELVYCILGSATVSLINPFNNKKTNIFIIPGQVANIPQGWCMGKSLVVITLMPYIHNTYLALRFLQKLLLKY